MNHQDILSPAVVIKSCRYKPIEELEALFQHQDINCRDAYKSTPLHEAAFWGREDIVQFLIDKGADALAEDQYGRTPLHWAQKRNHGKVAEILKGL